MKQADEGFREEVIIWV